MISPKTLLTEHLDTWTTAIKAKSSVGRGSGKNQEFYGIKKLRELILELAVRGLLVPQDSKDEPASDLLQRIARERAKLVEAGTIREENSLSKIGPEEESTDVPSGWDWCRLGSITLIVRGITFPASEKSKSPEPGRIACLRTSNVQEQIEWDDLLFIREEFVRRDDQFVLKNDIVMSMANSRELVGKVAIVQATPSYKTTFGGFLGVIRPMIVAPHFVMILLRSPRVKEAMIGSASQTTNIANVSLSKLKPLALPLPPLAEQHRIVAKVDELMELCDQLEQKQEDNVRAHGTLVQTLLRALTTTSECGQFLQAWQQIATNFDTLFTTESSIDQLEQAILQLAVTGKIVEQEGEWQNAKLQELADEIVDCPHSTPKWTSEGKICVRTSQFQPGYLDLKDTRFVSEETYTERVQRLEPAVDDILYSREGGILGVACRVPPLTQLCLGQRMMLIRAGSSLVPRYLELVLNSPFITEIALRKTTGAAAPRVNVSTVKAYPIPFPALDEQHRIVAKVDELMALCDRLKSSFQIVQTTQLHLTDNLVEAAI